MRYGKTGCDDWAQMDEPINSHGRIKIPLWTDRGRFLEYDVVLSIGEAIQLMNKLMDLIDDELPIQTGSSHLAGVTEREWRESFTEDYS